MNVSTHLEEAEEAVRSAILHLAYIIDTRDPDHEEIGHEIGLRLTYAADDIKHLRAVVAPSITAQLEELLGAPVGEATA